MSDIQRTVDELRFLLQKEVVENDDDLKNLVGAYSQHCHEINARLRRCHEFLKDGLRSEALHLADARPNLLDAVAQLDFPERAELNDVLTMYFIPTPEPLLLDVASDLNEAYAEHVPLAKLLDLHRLLALGRAPLSQRLTVLRGLWELDHSIPHWDEDIREMELARFREIEAAGTAAFKSNDAAQLKLMRSELENSDWREDVPDPLLKSIRAKTHQVVVSAGRKRMEELGKRLHDCLLSLDPQSARPIRDEWMSLQKQVNLPESDPLYQYSAPALEWMNEEDRKLARERAYQKGLADIQRALDNDVNDPDALQQLSVTIERLDRSLPPTVETRFRSRLRAAKHVEVRRKRMLLGLGLSIVGLFIVGVGTLIYLSSQSARIRQVATAAEAYINEDKLEEARKLIDAQPASTSEIWLSVQKKLVTAEAAERDRSTEWKAEIEVIKNSSDPKDVIAAMKRAKVLARTAEEKVEFSQLENAWKKREAAELAGREKAFRANLSIATESLKALEEAFARESDLNGLETKLHQAANLTTVLTDNRTAVSRELASQADLLESRLKAMRDDFSSRQKLAQGVERMKQALLAVPGTGGTNVQPGDFENALRQYAADTKNESRSRQFLAAAEESPLPMTIARQRLIERWKQLRPHDLKETESRLKEIVAFRAEFPQSPDIEVMQRYQTWLESIVRRYKFEGDPDDGAQQRTLALFNNKFVKEGHVLFVKDPTGATEDAYYLSDTRKVNLSGSTKISYLVGYHDEVKSVTLKSTDIVTPQTVAPPQQEIASKVRKTLREATRDTSVERWRPYYHELIDSIQKCEKLDPFLRFLLISKSLEFAGMGDRFLDDELTTIYEKLRDSNVDRSVLWMDPKNKEANEARRISAEVLEELPPLEDAFSGARKRQDELERQLFAKRFPVGWLEKNAKEWICHSNWQTAADFALSAVTKPDGKGHRHWIEIGRIRQGKFLLDPAAVETVGEASVVYAFPEDPENHAIGDSHSNSR